MLMDIVIESDSDDRQKSADSFFMISKNSSKNICVAIVAFRMKKKKNVEIFWFTAQKQQICKSILLSVSTCVNDLAFQ
jgi:hypothetical protein